MGPGQLLSSLVLYVGIAGLAAQNYCEQCDCTISETGEETRGIRNVKAQCNEGTITWPNPYGAIRLTLYQGYSGEYKSCFIVNSEFVKVKISQEFWANSRSPVSRAMSGDVALKPLLTASGRTKEYCVTSTTAVVLFLEPERSQNVTVLSRVTIQYDIERAFGVLTSDPMEECRPCEDKELIRAYCSSDFVVVGSMSGVWHNHETEKTEIGVDVSRIVRQKSTLFYRPDRNSRTLYGTITAPRKCGVEHGSGVFLFTGRLRLGQLKLGCAPYLREWESLVRQAMKDGTMECSLD